LIVFLWVMAVLGVFAVSVATRARLAAKIEGTENNRFQRSCDYLAAVNLARQFIEADEEPEVDFARDSWYGVPQGFAKMDFGGRFRLTITDEESKLDINSAPAEVLRKFFDLLRAKGEKLVTPSADLAAAIAAWRGTGLGGFGRSTSGFKHKGAAFESLEELYLIQYITPGDVEILRPYLTVYGPGTAGPFRVNLNTAHPLILEAIIATHNSGDFSKKMLLQKILEFRSAKTTVQGNSFPQVFRSEDLEASALITRLRLTPSVDMLALAGAFVQSATVDSHFFDVSVLSTLPGTESYEMEAVLGPRSRSALSGLVPLDILSWHEGLLVLPAGRAS